MVVGEGSELWWWMVAVGAAGGWCWWWCLVVFGGIGGDPHLHNKSEEGPTL